MIKNYMLTAWRNLVANRLNASINIAGLTVAFTVCILLFLMVKFEFSFDQMHEKKDHLYVAYNVSYAPEGDQIGTSMSYPAAATFKKEVPGIVAASGMLDGGNAIRYKGKDIEKDIRLVDNDFFSMFSFPVVAGNRKAPLAGLGDIVFDETTAKAVFGQEDPIGKMVSIKIGPAWKELRVSAIMQDVPKNSTINFKALARMELAEDYTKNKDNWNSQNHRVYIETSPAVSQAQVESQLRTVAQKYRGGNDEFMKTKGYRKDKNGDMFAFKTAPLLSMHFDNRIGFGTVARSYLYTMIVISIVVLVIACFNFVNLNVARAFTRAKEVGVRKTIGAGRAQIFMQLWAESLLLFGIAVVLSMVAASTLLTPFNTLFVEKLSMRALAHPGVLVSLVAGALFVSFLAGGYPAWLVSRFNAVEVLKGKVSVKRSSLLRSGLITFQFVMTCVLICSTFVIYKQFQHMRSAPMGYSQDAVISIPVKNAENAHRYIRELRQRLASQPQILSVTGSMFNLGIGEDHSEGSSSIGFTYNGKIYMSDMMLVDFDYLETLDIKPVAGRSFNRSFPTDTSSVSDNVIVSESMAAQFQQKNNIVGLSLATDTTSPKWTIVGIIPDIHIHSMYEKSGPLTLMMAKQQPLNYILVKTRSDNPKQAMAIVRDTYKQIEPDNTANPSFLTENTRRWYEKEERLSSIFCSAAVIAIMLSCLGLFAIVSLVIGQRRKEIGVRKVLGASVAGMAGLLSKDFVRLVILAFVIATPIAWYFLHQWLQDFEYRTNISWWIFPLAGFVALVIAVGTISVLTIRASMANPVKNLRTE